MPARTDEAEREAGKGGELDGGQNATHAQPRLARRERPAGGTSCQDRSLAVSLPRRILTIPEQGIVTLPPSRLETRHERERES